MLMQLPIRAINHAGLANLSTKRGHGKHNIMLFEYW